MIDPPHADDQTPFVRPPENVGDDDMGVLDVGGDDMEVGGVEGRQTSARDWLCHDRSFSR